MLYTATWCPYQIAFLDESASYGHFELVIDVLFSADIIISFFLPFEKWDGTMQYNHKKIAKNYITTTFGIDLVACFPPDLMNLLIRVTFHHNHKHQSDLFKSNNGKLLRIIRIQRIYKLLKIFRVFKFGKLYKYQMLIWKYLKGTISSERSGNVSRVILAFVSALFCTHIFACFFFLAAKVKQFSPDTWVYQVGLQEESPFFAWCFSLYWAFQTLTTVGYGDFGVYNGLELFITVVWMFIGVSFYTFVVAALTQLFTAEGTKQKDLQELHDALEL